MKLCRCGRVVKDRCEHCNPHAKHTKSTKDRGYDYRWDRLSRRKRIHNPLCEECSRQGMVTAATEVHHIVKIKDRPELRLEWSNLMSVCRDCHERIEKGS